MLVKIHLLLAAAFKAGLLAGAVIAASVSVDAGAAETPSAHQLVKAFIFKSINEQQDEETSGYKPAPPSLSLSQAAEMLRAGTIQPNPRP